VILATPDSYETIRRTVASLRAQTIRDRLELVIVAPSSAGLGLVPSDLTGFAGYRVVEVGAVHSIARANAAGVRSASAVVVALAEDHSFPDPRWAEALVEAHSRPWAAVGPAVRNGNPDSRISRADFLIAYCPWSTPAPRGVVDFLPGHNSSYKRAVLMAYGPELEAMLEAETVLHWDLRAKGYRLYLEPAAEISHINFARLAPWIPVQFHAGRVFAAARAEREGWSWPRRLLYALGSPLIPPVRLCRIARRAPAHRELLGALPMLVLGLVLDGVGQLVGYVSGAGRSRKTLTGFEFHRARHNAR
jgi:GT2 family glycosyltransferase